MNDKRTPFEVEVPKHKKKSKKKGLPRADHKHEYKSVLLHYYFDNPFKAGEKKEFKQPKKVCSICGRIGDTDMSRYEYLEVKNMPYRTHERVIIDEDSLEKWYVDDFFDKFAHKRGNYEQR